MYYRAVRAPMHYTKEVQFINMYNYFFRWFSCIKFVKQLKALDNCSLQYQNFHECPKPIVAALLEAARSCSAHFSSFSAVTRN